MDDRKLWAAHALRSAREKKSYSQHDVSSQAYISLKAYQRLEYGERDICNASMRIGLAVCLVLGLDPFVLVLPNGIEPKK